jgi:hypothetical protein
LFNLELIEEVFLVTEYAFDAQRLRKLLRARLDKAGVYTLTQTEAEEVIPLYNSSEKDKLCLLVKDLRSSETQAFESRYIYNCTYANLNRLLARSGLTRLFLRHEATEIALLRVSECLRNVGITVMCGPFFSMMPFPAKGLSSFSHVSYTPHYEWAEIPSDKHFAPHHPQFPLKSNIERMTRDAMRYLPVLSECAYVDSLWEVKTILPQNDSDDGRPILFKSDPSVPGLISVLGGKIDNIFDLDATLHATIIR